MVNRSGIAAPSCGGRARNGRGKARDPSVPHCQPPARPLQALAGPHAGGEAMDSVETTIPAPAEAPPFRRNEDEEINPAFVDAVSDAVAAGDRAALAALVDDM